VIESRVGANEAVVDWPERVAGCQVHVVPSRHTAAAARFGSALNVVALSTSVGIA
jgi:hypothetical protein